MTRTLKIDPKTNNSSKAKSHNIAMSSNLERPIDCKTCGHVKWQFLTDKELQVWRNIRGPNSTDEHLEECYTVSPCEGWKRIKEIMDMFAAAKLRQEEAQSKRDLEEFVRLHRNGIDDYIQNRHQYQQWKETGQTEEAQSKRDLEKFVRLHKNDIDDYIINRDEYKDWKKNHQTWRQWSNTYSTPAKKWKK